MRTIKFRAWQSNDGAIGGRMNYDVLKNNTLSQIENWDWELMQFTGLLDKNSKEIYEGDIVMYEDTESEYVDVGVGEVKVAETTVNSFAEIKFEKGCFGLQIKEGELFKYSKGFQTFQWWESEMGEEPSVEIIGNIYQDKDLLE